MSRRVWKLQDYVAHPGRVHCARLGEKSGQVLATGGEDKRVNIWKVGKPNAMMSLTGHTSAVDCLVFDKQEEVLVVGCAGGSMQVWNLEYRKMAGTLTGHRTACGAVEFHPYGEFFASGSADTNLKIWDLRRKSCIQTYKGHTGAITSIRFSPHGRWVATGGLDSQVKVWDLTAGKLMRDLDVHKGPITSIAFHPKEYLLATGSADRTMRLWSLETFQTVGSTELGSSPVAAVKFYVEEQAIVSVSHDALRVYPVDGLTTPQDTIEVDWKGLQDTRLCAGEEKLIAVSTEGAQLGIWVADLQKREATSVKGAGYSRLHSRGGPPNALRLQNQAPRRAQRAFSDAEDSEGEQQGPDADGAERRDDARGPLLHEPAPEPSAASGSDFAPRGGAGQEAPRACPYPAAAAPLASPLDEEPRGYARGEPRPGDAREGQAPSPELGQRSPAMAMGSGQGPGGLAAEPAPRAAVALGSEPQRPPRRAPDVTLEQIAQLASQHPQMMGILQRRSDQIRRLKDLWARGNIAGLHGVLNMPQDHAVFCDFARAILRQRQEQAINLDACQALLPILKDLLGSKYDDFVITALEFTEVLLQNFGGVIQETRLSCAHVPERQLDLPREERLRKCNACHDHLRDIYRLLSEGQTGSRFSAFRSSLHTFLQSC